MSYLLHIRFNLQGKTGNFQEDIAHAFPFERATQNMNALPNLKWKIWGVRTDDAGQLAEASGFYLYPTKEAAEHRAEEGIATLPDIIPGLSNITATVWEVLDDYSLATHAPVDVPLIADLK